MKSELSMDGSYPQNYKLSAFSGVVIGHVTSHYISNMSCCVQVALQHDVEGHQAQQCIWI